MCLMVATTWLTAPCSQLADKKLTHNKIVRVRIFWHLIIILNCQKAVVEAISRFLVSFGNVICIRIAAKLFQT